MYDKLANMVGRRFDYLGDRWLLIEVMPELDSLVLRRTDAEPRVQTNQFGHANRKGAETLTLRISDPQSEGYSEEIITLLTGIQKAHPA